MPGGVGAAGQVATPWGAGVRLLVTHPRPHSWWQQSTIAALVSCPWNHGPCRPPPQALTTLLAPTPQPRDDVSGAHGLGAEGSPAAASRGPHREREVRGVCTSEASAGNIVFPAAKTLAGYLTVGGGAAFRAVIGFCCGTGQKGQGQLTGRGTRVLPLGSLTSGAGGLLGGGQGAGGRRPPPAGAWLQGSPCVPRSPPLNRFCSW